MASTSNSPFSRGRLMATLTTVQHTSALVFGSFLFVHLAAPAVAVVAPRAESLELAAKTMVSSEQCLSTNMEAEESHHC